MSVATRPPKSSRRSSSMGEFPDAVRAWANHLYTRAALCASNRMRLHPDIFYGGAIEDWRNHVSPTERRLFDAAIRAGVWVEPVFDPDVESPT